MNSAHPYLPVGSGPVRQPWLWLGTWSLGGEGFGRVTGRNARATIELAFENGIRHFDTAGLYAHGKSEILLGKVLRGCREQTFLASKGGLRWKGNEVIHDASAEGLRRSLEESLTRLGTDYLDLFQLHWPDPAVPLEKSLEALCDLQREGTIRYWGAGNLDANEVRRALPPNARIPHQVHHNPVHRADAVLDAGHSQQRAYNCIISPLEQGLLGSTRSSQGMDGLANRDIRRRNPLFRNPRVQEWVRGFQEYSAACELPRAGLVLLWLVAQPNIDAVIAGPKTPAQLHELFSTLFHGEWLPLRKNTTTSEIDQALLSRRLRASLPEALWEHLNNPPDSFEV